MATKVKRPFAIVRQDEVLARFKSNQKALDKLEGYIRRYSNDYLELVGPLV